MGAMVAHPPHNRSNPPFDHPLAVWLKLHDAKRAVAALNVRELFWNNGPLPPRRWHQALRRRTPPRVLALTGNGAFVSSLADVQVRTLFVQGLTARWRLMFPDIGCAHGLFAVTALRYNGVHEGALLVTIRLQSVEPPSLVLF